MCTTTDAAMMNRRNFKMCSVDRIFSKFMVFVLIHRFIKMVGMREDTYIGCLHGIHSEGCPNNPCTALFLHSFFDSLETLGKGPR
jgi:hypothetical protein